MANRTVKRGEIWDSGVQVEYKWGDFDLLVFNVIWGLFGAKNTILKTLLLSHYDSFSAKQFICVSFDSSHKTLEI